MFSRLGSGLIAVMTVVSVGAQIGLASDWLEPEPGMSNPLVFPETFWEVVGVLCTLGIAAIALKALKQNFKGVADTKLVRS